MNTKVQVDGDFHLKCPLGYIQEGRRPQIAAAVAGTGFGSLGCGALRIPHLDAGCKFTAILMNSREFSHVLTCFHTISHGKPRKNTSLALRMGVQLLLALWVEATVLYRLMCDLSLSDSLPMRFGMGFRGLKALSGHRRSWLCLQITAFWWMQAPFRAFKGLI